MNLIKKIIIIASEILICFTMSSCGFHLRQNLVTLPAPYKKVYLETPYPYSQFSLSLKEAISHSSHPLWADNPNGALKVVVTKENFTTQEDTLSASQQTRHYSVFYTIDYKVYFPKQLKPKLMASLQSQSSAVTFPNEELSSSLKIDVIKKELAHDLVNQLFYQLSSMKA